MSYQVNLNRCVLPITYYQNISSDLYPEIIFDQVDIGWDDGFSLYKNLCDSAEDTNLFKLIDDELYKVNYFFMNSRKFLESMNESISDLHINQSNRVFNLSIRCQNNKTFNLTSPDLDCFVANMKLDYFEFENASKKEKIDILIKLMWESLFEIEAFCGFELIKMREIFNSIFTDFNQSSYFVCDSNFDES